MPFAILSTLGSSPLTRGKLDKVRGHQGHGGLIPTHAGKTMGVVVRRCVGRAHPHSRRENGILAAMSIVRIGSSPLTRGKRQLMRRCPFRLGLIPTHAGKTWRSWCQSCWWGAHPRSCGEDALISVSLGAAMGSSPLTRGKLSLTVGYSGLIGLIPAHAGKTRSGQSLIFRGWAHPRSRGENSHVPEALPVREGSSPLTRGKLLMLSPRRLLDGFIPTHAGKTLQCRSPE